MLASPALPSPSALLGARPAFARGWRRYAVAFVGWTVVGVLLSQQAYAMRQLAGARPTSAWALSMFADMWLWALFTPAILDLGRDYPVDRAHWPTRVPLHVASALAFAALDAVAMWAIRPWLCDCPREPLRAAFTQGLFASEASYLVLVAMGVAARHAEALRERERAAERLSRELAEARLAAVSAQLRPHFLFNTLNAIAELVHVDPAAADRTVTALGALLRRSLAAGDRQEVALRDELACVDEYLAIVATRLDARLRVTTAVDPSVFGARVPSFLLQPLVENAVRHGVEPVPAGGTIEIAAWREGDTLCIDVRDDGAGLGVPNGSLGPGASCGGHGVRATRERLRLLYGDAQTFTLRPRDGGRGTVASVRLPFAT